MHDVIVVGSGAGGAAAAYRLAKRGLSVLMLEKGKALPRDGSTLSTLEVFKNGKFKNKEPWYDSKGQQFILANITMSAARRSGTVLPSCASRRTSSRPTPITSAWPGRSATSCRPYYDEAEQLLHVNRFPNGAELQRLVDHICRHDPSWRSEALPLGLKPEILEDEQEAKHFDGYASVAGYKADAERNLIEAIEGLPNFTLLTKKKVVGFLHPETEPGRIEGVVCRDGSYYPARHVVLAAGAMTRPASSRTMAANGLALPCAQAVGGNFKFHLNSALIAFSPFTRHDVLRKTAIFFNDSHPHTTVQCLGWLDGELLAPRSRPPSPASSPTPPVPAPSASSSPPRTAPARQQGDLGRRRDADPRLRPRPHPFRQDGARGGHRRLHPPPAACRPRRHRPLCRHGRHRPRPGLDGHRPRSRPLGGRSPGAVHGMEGLHVADGSVLASLQPGEPGAHHLCLGPAPRRAAGGARAMRSVTARARLAGPSSFLLVAGTAAADELRVDSVAITVSDMERALPFYTDVLPSISSPTTSRPGRHPTSWASSAPVPAPCACASARGDRAHRLPGARGPADSTRQPQQRSLVPARGADRQRHGRGLPAPCASTTSPTAPAARRRSPTGTQRRRHQGLLLQGPGRP